MAEDDKKKGDPLDNITNISEGKSYKQLLCPMRSSHVGDKYCVGDTCSWWIKAEYEGGDKVEGCCVPVGVDAIERHASAFEDHIIGDEEEEPTCDPPTEETNCAGCDGSVDPKDYQEKDGLYFCEHCEPGDEDMPGGDNEDGGEVGRDD